MRFALAGNQNCGKTTLFNQLTGSNQHVGNFPGVTVDSKSGSIRNTKGDEVVDLPGIYSLRPYSAEEIVTRDFILDGRPDGIINIVDATNIERNLYLTLQMIEMQVPMVLALNMMDEVRANGGTVDTVKLSELLGIPVVPISAAKGEGIADLTELACRTAATGRKPEVYDFCPPGPVHRCIHAVTHVVEDHAERARMSARWAAMNVIEGNSDIVARLALDENELELCEHSIVEMERETGLDRNAAIADMRYSFIESVCAETVKKPEESRERKRSRAIDNVLTHRIFALPIFVGIMLLVFYLTFEVIGAFLSDLLAMGIKALAGVTDAALTAYGINPVVHSLVIDGLFGGVGNVVSFLPIIVVLFFFLSMLEDTGYMARVAFVMDKLLRRIGLSGKSVVPMLIGFGCTVPAVMATRTLTSDRDRRMTVLLTPFMSCSAKIPIYSVFVAAFFPKYKALAMGGLYVFGILIGVLAALVFGKTLFRGNPIPFVMELPNYRMPSVRTTLQLMWDKAKDFLHRAFTVIFVASLVIWFCRRSTRASTRFRTIRRAFSPRSADFSRRSSRRSALRTGAYAPRSSRALWQRKPLSARSACSPAARRSPRFSPCAARRRFLCSRCSIRPAWRRSRRSGGSLTRCGKRSASWCFSACLPGDSARRSTRSHCLFDDRKGIVCP